MTEEVLEARIEVLEEQIERLQEQLNEANEAIERFYNTNCKLCTADNDLCNTCRNKVIIDYSEKWGVK